VYLATSGVNIMMRKIAMALATVAVVAAGSTLSASAMHGGFGGGHFGGGGGHFGGFGGGHFGGHFGGFGHPAMAHPAMFHNHFDHRFGFRDRDRFFDHRFAFRDRDRFFDRHRFFRHRFFGPRFAFFGAGYPYGYYDGCYSRVWTPWGWRWRYVCY
jgi:hypothetical protein